MISDLFFKRYFQAGYVLCAGMLCFFISLFILTPGFFILDECTLDAVHHTGDKRSLQEVFFQSSKIPEHPEPLKGIGAFIIPTSHPDPQLLSQDLPSLKIPFQKLKAAESLEGNTSFQSALHSPKKEPCNHVLHFVQHVQAWRSFLASSYEWGLVVQDDARLSVIEPFLFPNQTSCPPHSSPAKILQELSKTTIAGFISLGGNRKPIYIKLHPRCDLPLIYKGTLGDTAYLINRHAATELLKKAHLYLLPLHSYLSRFWEFDVRFARPLFFGFETPSDLDSAFNNGYPFQEDSYGFLVRLKKQIFIFKKMLAELFYKYKILWT